MELAAPVLPLLALLGLNPTLPELVVWVSPPETNATTDASTSTATSTRVALEPAIVRASLHPRTAGALVRALAAAEAKLLEPCCREIFREFHDETGRPLGHVLAASGSGPEGLLRRLAFADGTATDACRNRTTLAWTYLGGQTIYLCSAGFAAAAHSNLRFAANLLIHEGLHTLGLGENPPSSTTITERVATHCGY